MEAAQIGFHHGGVRLYPPPSHRSPVVTLEVDASADPQPEPGDVQSSGPVLRLERDRINRRPRRLDQPPVVYRSGRLRSRSRSGGGFQRPILEADIGPTPALAELPPAPPADGDSSLKADSRPDVQPLLGLDFGFMLARSTTTQTAAVTFLSLVLLIIVFLPLIDRLLG